MFLMSRMLPIDGRETAQGIQHSTIDCKDAAGIAARIMSGVTIVGLLNQLRYLIQETVRQREINGIMS